MKKIALSLAALAALSTAAFASYRDVTTVQGNQDVAPFTASSATPVEPLMAIAVSSKAEATAYQRLLINSEEPGSSTR